MDNEPTNTDTTPETAPAPAPNPAPANTPSEPVKTEQGTSVPEYTPEAFNKLNEAYSLTKPETENKQNTPPLQNTEEENADYTLTFPDTFAERTDAQAFNAIIAPIAKQSGIDGASFGKLFADAYTAIEEASQRAEWQNRFQQDADLKHDWGADYEANMQTARSHIAFLKEKAGLTDADLACFQSPKGMRALYAMATAHAAPPAAGLETCTLTEKAWAAAVMQPDHADHDAFTNPMNPRYKEINQRWLRANGH